jgi:hypothetical protein
VQVLLNLVERWSIKCPEKKATWTTFRRNQWWRRWTIPNDVSFGPSFFFFYYSVSFGQNVPFYLKETTMLWFLGF